MKKKLLKLLFLLLLSISANAQLKSSGKNVFGKKAEGVAENHEKCGTVHYMNQLRQKYPQLPTEAQFENWMATEIKKREESLANGRSISAVYNIPVVIHIVHNGDCYGTGENITDAQAISQITVLNQDYRRLAGTPGGANTTGLATDIEINFVLAKRTPTGDPTTGIVRHNITPYSNDVAEISGGGVDWETTADVEIMKQATIWDPTKYLNMWTIRPGGLTLLNGGLSDLLGYAQFPQGSTLLGVTANTVANTDGVVAAYNAMGSMDLDDGTFIMNGTYDYGRTMTHEVGHWLGLRHIWGDNSGLSACPSTNNDTTEDFCADTPAAAEANYDCVLTTNTCTSTPGNDMVQNYMDYTPDSCMDTFTPNQKSRMQTCMANAVRRNTLNTSNGSTVSAKAGIYFKYGVGCATSFSEGTNCSYTDYNVVLKTTNAPTADVTVSFTTSGSSTATNIIDYEIFTPSVVFASGSTSDKNLIIRVYNDGIKENTETIILTATIANTSNGIVLADYKDIIVNIVDNDDLVTSASSSVNLINETFETPTYLTAARDLDGDTNNWGVGITGTTAIAAGFTSNFAFSRSWIPSTDTGLTPDNILYTPTPITIPTGVTSLSFRIGTTQGGTLYYKEHYSVYLSTVNPATISAASLNSITPVINNAEIATPAGSAVITNNVSSYAGQTVYLIIRHHNTNNMNWLMLDDVVLSNNVTNEAQAEVNSITKYNAFISQAGTFTAKDSTNGKLMVEGTITNFNYGCSDVQVSRSVTSAGASAMNLGSNTDNSKKVTAKTITITTANPNPTGSATLKFYFTVAEIAGWETATGNNRNALKVIKEGVSSVLTTSLSTLGSNIVILTANVTNGISGVYYFGTDASLSAINSVDSLENFTLYPNPNKGNFNIQFSSNSNNNIIVLVHDIRGREIFNKTFSNNGLFNENLQLSNAQSGIYLVTIQDGSRKEVKKIVIE
jgi:hypothetical protein